MIGAVGRGRHDQRRNGAGGREGEEAASPWRGAGPELAMAAVLAIAATGAGYLMAGWAGLSAVTMAAAAIALAMLRILLPKAAPDQARMARKKPAARPLGGYARRRYAVETAIGSLVFYNEELRPVLEHLLAARLAQRHGVHLYQNPAAARALLCREPGDADLWFWLDPATRPTESRRGRKEQSGIPGHTLARLLDRLELL